jgi:hypothetical protein
MEELIVHEHADEFSRIGKIEIEIKRANGPPARGPFHLEGEIRYRRRSICRKHFASPKAKPSGCAFLAKSFVFKINLLSSLFSGSNLLSHLFPGSNFLF